MDLRTSLSTAVLLAALTVMVGAQQSPPANTSASLSTSSCPGTGCVTLNVSGYSTVSVQVTGTWTGTLTYNGSVDGTNYQSLNCTPINSTSPVTSTTGNGVFSCSVPGLSRVQVQFTPGTGTAVVSIQAALAGGGAGAGGGGGGGTSSSFGQSFPGSGTAVGFKDSGGTLMAAGNLDAGGRLVVNCGAGCSGATDTVGSTVALNALNAAATVSLQAEGGAGFLLAAGTLTGTLTPEVSYDNGTTWLATLFFDPSTQATAATMAFTNPNVATQRTILVASGASNARVRVSAFTSGTANGTLRSTQNSSGNYATLTAGSAVTVSGTPTVNVTQFGSSAVVTGTGASGAGIPRVTLSNDSTLAANQSVDVARIAGAATATAASGVQKVGVTGNAGAALDAAGQNAASPANELLIAGQFNTTPTTITSGNISPLQLTSAGRLIVDNSAVTQPTNLTQANGVSLGSPSAYGTSPGAVNVVGVNAFITNTPTVTANAGTNLNTSALALDTSVNGILLAQGSTTSGQKGPVIQGAVTTASPTYTTGQTSPLSLDTSGSLRVNVVSGSTGNAASGNTGSAPPTQADYLGLNVGGTLRGQTGVNPSGVVYAAQVDLTSAGGTSLAATGNSLNVNVTNGTYNTTEAATYATGASNVAGVIGFNQIYNPISGLWQRWAVGQQPMNNSVSVSIANDQTNVRVNNAAVNGWPIATGLGPSTVGTQRVTLSSDSQVAASAQQNVYVGGLWKGVTGLALGQAIAPGMAILDANGNQITSFGGGSQFGMGTAQASNAAGTIALGYDGTNVRGLSVNASGQLNVIFPSAQAVTSNVTQYGGTNVVSAGVAGLFAVGGAAASGAAKSGNPLQTGGVFNTTQPTVTTGQAVESQYTARGAAIVATGADTFNVTLSTGGNTVGAVTQGTSPWVDNLTQVAGTNVNTAAAGTLLVGAADGAGNKLTSNSTTTSAKFGLDTNILSILGTAPTTAGKLDVKGADGDVFVRQATAANLNATVVQGNAGTNAQAWWAQLGDTATGPVAVKAASTAAAATDKALVVAISPNNTVPANITQFGGNAVATGTGASGVGIPRVTVANDSNILATPAYADNAVLANVMPEGALYNDLGSLAAVTSGNVAAPRMSSNRVLYTQATDKYGTPDATNQQLLTQLVTLTAIDAAAASVRMGASSPLYANASAMWASRLAGLAFTPTPDPCASANKGNVTISQTASTQLLQGQSGKRIFVCSIFVGVPDAENISVVEGTGAVCGTGTAGIVGGTTAATGPNFTSTNGGGWTSGGGSGAVAVTNGYGTNVCLLQSGTGRIAGNFTYVYQ